ncbi:tripartite tricarboxylate transporter substrate binding protein [Aquincola sp. S2]|uniref:Tripartite tricarboxylate transporter substrate binding protein n=1 Tax=Pseudaquabacterium terrae TaxID=2732868 RepID=A0ABX2EAP6_9BURK|nr:tripartite tricarboxylate transporter substrate binding protein [Aquabacterium terrae]NRF65925.1 tripartite tricarboxylate transporter substrate binding protein [Aquabacterium terrae]
MQPLVNRCLAVLATTLLCAGIAQAQPYPNKPIRVIVPFAPGGTSDQMGRALAEKMAAMLGQPVIIDNKPGANGLLGADIVAKAAPDGYTILLGTNSTNAALKYLMKKLPYDQDTAFAPIGTIGSVPLMVVLGNDVPAKTLKEFVDLAKARPGDLSFAYTATSEQVAAEMLARMAGIQLNPIPYKSGGTAMTDLLGGRVTMITVSVAATAPHHRAGKIRGLAVTSAKRSAAAPELPTVNEALGLKDYELIAYFAVFAPAGTPAEVIARLNQAVNAAASSKEIQDKFAPIGFVFEPGTPEALARRNKLETAKWEKLIRDAKIEPQ